MQKKTPPYYRLPANPPSEDLVTNLIGLALLAILCLGLSAAAFGLEPVFMMIGTGAAIFITLLGAAWLAWKVGILKSH